MGYQGYHFVLSIKDNFHKDLKIITRPRKYCWVPAHITDVANYLKNLGHEAVREFQVQPKRWVVERTFAWLGKYRRLSKDYEFNIIHSEGFIYLAMIKNMLKKIVKYQV